MIAILLQKKTKLLIYTHKLTLNILRQFKKKYKNENLTIRQSKANNRIDAVSGKINERMNERMCHKMKMLFSACELSNYNHTHTHTLLQRFHVIYKHASLYLISLLWFILLLLLFCILTNNKNILTVSKEFLTKIRLFFENHILFFFFP